MDKAVGYDNLACYKKEDIDEGVKPTSIEMEQVIFDVGMTMAKCCGGSNVNTDHLSNIKLTDVNIATVCQPKCPAVKASPWDPMKTRFVAALVVAILIWIMFGVLAIKF